MSWPRVAQLGVVGVAVLASLVACGIENQAERDVCTQYRQFQDSADALRELDPSSASADDVRAAVDDFQDELNQVVAAADGSLNSQVSSLRAAAVNVREAAVVASQEGFAAARPMLQDSLTEARQSLAALDQGAEVLCPTAN
jgi:hypothetical protein